MSCPPEIRNDRYEFFDNIYNYEKFAEEIKNDATSPDITSCCTTFMLMWNGLINNEIAKNTCENFLKLYKKLPTTSDYKKKNWGFLIYWLNFELGKVKKNICISEFYDDMESHCTDHIHHLLPKGVMYNVKKDELNKMYLLYDLYENYRKLNDILSGQKPVNAGSLLGPSAKCCSDYAEANYLCNGEINEFCTQLQKFKTEYDVLYNTEILRDPEYTNNFIKLSECKNTNVMSTALIGTTVGLVPLLVGLYKFTPLRQLMNFKKGKLAEQYRNNDDEMRDIMLMDQGSEHISSQQGRYNIKYHSV